MHISRVHLENFRNFGSLDLSFDQGLVVLVGPNGSGKTNFLESIYFGGTLRRFPESKFSQLFREGENFFRIRIITQAEEENSQEIGAEKGEKANVFHYKLDNVDSARNQYAGVLPVVSFLPQDLNLLTRSPGNRRRYLDETLSLVSAQYRYAHNQYERALKQRNRILQEARSGQPQTQDIGVWSDQLAEYGAFVCAARQIFLDHVNGNLEKIISVLSPNLSRANFTYLMSGAKTKDDFLAKLNSHEAEEKNRGVTLFGPHRDEFSAKINGKDAVGFISRGEMRSITLALKFLEKEYVREKTGKLPILLLDDVFSEFDVLHQKAMAGLFKDLGQVFLTSAHFEEISKFLPGEPQIYNIEAGKVFSTIQYV